MADKVRLNVIGAARSYVLKMIQDKRIRDFKCLILCPFTTQCVASVVSQSEMLQNQVFLVEALSSTVQRTSNMLHLTAIVFIR